MRFTEFWRQVLLINLENDEKVTEDLAREWSDLNNRAQRMPPPALGNRAELSQRTIEGLGRMSVPTLLLWSDNDHERPVEIVGRYGYELLGSPDKGLEIVANCGHILPLDCGSESARNALRFRPLTQRNGIISNQAEASETNSATRSAHLCGSSINEKEPPSENTSRLKSARRSATWLSCP